MDLIPISITRPLMVISDKNSILNMLKNHSILMVIEKQDLIKYLVVVQTNNGKKT